LLLLTRTKRLLSGVVLLLLLLRHVAWVVLEKSVVINFIELNFCKIFLKVSRLKCIGSSVVLNLTRKILLLVLDLIELRSVLLLYGLRILS